ncbi:MAG TPA: hypothetical protein VJ938_03845 [Acidimicrobiia bacterium]|nr:hypothetical protein [Acidimicrobiia bacterium]
MGSERNTGRRRRRKAQADCRQGIHRFAAPQLIGGGMSRQTCSVCGAVSIDLRNADDPASLRPPPFRGGGRRQ